MEQKTKNKKFRKFNMIFVALLVMGIVVAGTISYLSNSISSDVVVSSPLEMTYDVEPDLNIVGSGVINYKVTTVNNADVNVPSYPVTEITAPEGTVWNGNEFTSIVLRDPNYPDGIEVLGLLYYVKADGTLGKFEDVASEDANTVKLFFDNNADGVAQTYDREVGFNEWNDISITTASTIATGTYGLKSCQLFDITGVCN